MDVRVRVYLYFVQGCSLCLLLGAVAMVIYRPVGLVIIAATLPLFVVTTIKGCKACDVIINEARAKNEARLAKAEADIAAISAEDLERREARAVWDLNRRRARSMAIAMDLANLEREL